MSKLKDAQTDNPIFIVGAARSGTTLLQYMLKSHPDISFPTAESHFFIPFYERRNDFGDLSQLKNIQTLLTAIYKQHQRFFDSDVHGITFNAKQLAEELHQENITAIPDIISAIFQKNAAAEGKVRWGDKTPYYILHLETIMEMFPNAQIIHLIRDGRDCSSSMLERKWDFQIFNTYHTAYIWNKYVQTGKNFGKKFPDKYFEIRYEDILNQPQESIQSLCKFLGIKYDTSIIDFKKSSVKGKTPLLQRPLQKNNQNKWRNKLSNKQLTIFESVAGATLSDCGYELATTNPKLKKYDWFFNEVHIKLCHLYAQKILNK